MELSCNRSCNCSWAALLAPHQQSTLQAQFSFTNTQVHKYTNTQIHKYKNLTQIYKLGPIFKVQGVWLLQCVDSNGYKEWVDSNGYKECFTLQHLRIMKRACFSFFHTSLLKSTCNPSISVPIHSRRTIGVSVHKEILLDPVHICGSSYHKKKIGF